MRPEVPETSMEFPGNVNTNIFTIGGVERISWSRWSRTDRQALAYPEDTSDDDLAASAVAYKLRENDAHVYHDANGQQLWLFDLLASTQTDAQAQILASHGFSRLSYSTFEAASLRMLEDQVSKTVSGDKHATSPSATEYLSRFGRSISESASIYNKTMLAISSSLIHRLVKKDRWMLLGDSMCIDLLAMGDESLEQNWLDPWSTTTPAVVFESKWDPTGTVAVFFLVPHIDRLCSITQRIMAIDQPLQLGSQILLSPSGVSTKYRGMLTNELSSDGLISVFKARCTINLTHQGLCVSSKSDWVIVEVPPADSEPQNAMLGSKESLLTIWPAEYAICGVAAKSGQSQNLDLFESSRIVDPLARVEAWYTGRAARAKTVQIAQKEAESKVQQQSSQQDLSDLDVASEIASPIFREVVPSQDVSGIYPTPPDGLLSQVSETPASNVQQEASPNLANVSQLNDTYNHPSYSNGTNEDLFGDMDMDMVGEADFNFFDEPGMENEEGPRMMENVPLGLTSVEEKIDESSGTTPRVSSKVDESTVAKGPAMEVLYESKAEPLSVHATSSLIIEGSSSPLDTKILEAENLPLEKVAPSSTPGKGVSEELSPYRSQQKDSSSSGIAKLDRGSFNPLLLAKLDFESKYSNQGRFDYPPVESHDVYPSSLSSKNNRREIYEIGLNQESTSSVDSDEDEDLLDDQATNVQGYDIKEDLRIMDELYSNKMKRDAKESVTHPETPTSPGSGRGEVGQGATTNLSTPPSVFFAAAVRPTLVTDAFQAADLSEKLYTSEESSFIQVAQLVADQTGSRASCSLDLLGPETTIGSTNQAKLLYSESLTSVVLGSFPSAEGRRLADLIKTGDEMSELSDLLYELDGSTIGIRRMGTMTDISSSATPFWEELSLGPRSGPKDLNAFCIFPKKDYLVRPTKTFLEMMKGAYQACNLGRHIHDGPESAYPHGLVPFSTNGDRITKDVGASLAKFAKYLAGLRLRDGNFIIYMLNTSDERAIPDMCSAFSDLFQAYRSALEDENLKNPNDLVLQIVPSSMVFASDRLVVPSPTEYKKFAFQVYDRCGPVSSNGQEPQGPYVCAPAICLSKPVPKAIDFKLVSDPSWALLDAGDCLHLAYKWETGQQWLAASWTNNFGTLQWSAAYWLSKDDDAQKSFAHAATTMLETTMDMFLPRKASCRLLVVKDSPFEIHEVDTWAAIISDNFSSLHFTLLRINSDPSLMLFPSRIPNSISELPDSFASPVSTPHTTGISPEVPPYISTPGGTAVQGATPTAFGETDPEARLIDVTDDSWAALVDINATASLKDLGDSMTKSRCFLIKRAGTQDQDGFLATQIDIVYGLEPFQPLRKEVLGMYRNLALLARVRNIVDAVMGILPIHVATVKKAHAALCRTMRYGG